MQAMRINFLMRGCDTTPMVEVILEMIMTSLKAMVENGILELFGNC